MGGNVNIRHHKHSQLTTQTLAHSILIIVLAQKCYGKNSEDLWQFTLDYQPALGKVRVSRLATSLLNPKTTYPKMTSPPWDATRTGGNGVTLEKGKKLATVIKPEQLNDVYRTYS